LDRNGPRLLICLSGSHTTSHALRLSGTHRPIAPSPLAGEGGVRGSLGESKPIEGIATRGEKPLTRIASCDALRPLPQGERRGFAATRVRDAPADRSLSPCGRGWGEGFSRRVEAYRGIATRGEEPLTRIASCDALRPLPQGERREFAATPVRDAPPDRSLAPCGGGWGEGV